MLRVLQGLLLANGPGVMKGYYKDDSATAKAFKAGDGWFDTGDLGWRAPSKRAAGSSGCFDLCCRTSH
jgi:long-subunit acyl-CoA synthetase (AMP-forming)